MIVKLPLREKFGETVNTDNIIGFQQRIHQLVMHTNGWQDKSYHGDFAFHSQMDNMEEDTWVTNIHLDDGTTVSAFATVQQILSKCSKKAFNCNSQAFSELQDDIPITLVELDDSTHGQNVVRTTLKEFKHSSFLGQQARINYGIDQVISESICAETYDWS